MPLVYITGTPGSGKSTVLHELQARGHKAYGTDEHDYSRWVNRKTGEVAVPPKEYDLHAWYEDHEWTLNPEAIAKLREDASAAGETAFLCGVAAGTDEVEHLFDQTVVLTADAATLKHRIATRTNSNFGKTPAELKIILEWQGNHVENYRKQGAIIIDAAKPVEQVADEIVKRAA